VVKSSCVKVNSLGKKWLSEIRQNLSIHRTEDRKRVVLVCKLLIVSRMTLLLQQIKIGILTCN
jgi:RNA binding exosome subunit